jgi:hypothetical protein
VSAALTAAVSASQTFEKIGSYAGLAAMIGLGVLALLYFAQAREVKRLREWAGRAPERAAEVEQRVQQDAQRRVIAQPQTPAAQLHQTPPGAVNPTAGLTGDAATRAAAAALVAARGPVGPTAPPPGQLARPVVPGVPGVSPGAPAPASGAAATPAPGAVPPAPGAATPPAATPGSPQMPAPGTAAGAPGAGPAQPGIGRPAAMPAPGAPGSVPAQPSSGAPGSVPAQPASAAGTQVAPPKPASPAAAAAALATHVASKAAGTATPKVVAQPPAVGNGAGQDTHESAAARPLPPAPAYTPPPRPPRASEPSTGGGGLASSPGRILAIVVGVLVVLVVGFLVISALGGSDKKTPPNKIQPPSANSSGAQPSAPPAPVNRAETTTSVLNGTTQAGLARTLGNKLKAAGFNIVNVSDNVDQTLPATVVYYSAGNERAARAVAKIIAVSSTAVEPIDRNTSVSGSDAKVVVTVGADSIP